MCTKNIKVSQTWKEDGYDGDVDMPGSLDVGAPMIIHENGRRTIIGMFLKQMQGAAVFNQITPDTFNWIQENADWTQESSCSDPESTFTSCHCGTANSTPRKRGNNRSLLCHIKGAVHIICNHILGSLDHRGGVVSTL